MMVVAYDYKGLRVIAYPGRAPLMGSKTIHGPNELKTVREHLTDSGR